MCHKRWRFDLLPTTFRHGWKNMIKSAKRFGSGPVMFTRQSKALAFHVIFRVVFSILRFSSPASTAHMWRNSDYDIKETSVYLLSLTALEQLNVVVPWSTSTMCSVMTRTVNAKISTQVTSFLLTDFTHRPLRFVSRPVNTNLFYF